MLDQIFPFLKSLTLTLFMTSLGFYMNFLLGNMSR